MAAVAPARRPQRPASTIRWSVLLAAVLLLPSVASAQRGEIAGRVVDALGTGLDGAVVRLLNTSLSTLSAGQGSFRLIGVPAGSHTLVVNRIGFAQRLERILVRADGTTSLTVQLTPASLRLDELVVSAEKREEDVQALPYAVAVITSAQIEEKRIQSPSDLSGLVPNLMHVNTGSSGFNLVSIRGINSATGNGQENAVAQYVDGVYQFDAANTNFQFLDVERIEVLRGPQGTLYGRGAMGGVINIVTRQPTSQRGGNVSVDLGNRGLQRYRLSYAVPLVADKLFLNAGALHFRHGGFFDNDFTGDRFDGRNSIAGAVKLKLVPSPAWSLDLDLKAERDRDRGVYPWAASDTAAIARPSGWTSICRTRNDGRSATARSPSSTSAPWIWSPRRGIRSIIVSPAPKDSTSTSLVSSWSPSGSASRDPRSGATGTTRSSRRSGSRHHGPGPRPSPG